VRDIDRHIRISSTWDPWRRGSWGSHTRSREYARNRGGLSTLIYSSRRTSMKIYLRYNNSLTSDLNMILKRDNFRM
jgi:hypothetical protein